MKMKLKLKRTYIVSTYNNYEWINTEESLCKLFLMIKKALQGYRVFNISFKNKAKIYNLTKWEWIKNLPENNCFITKYKKGSDQITFHTPYIS